MRILISAILAACPVMAFGQGEGGQSGESTRLFSTGQLEVGRDTWRAEHWRDGYLGSYALDLDLSRLAVTVGPSHRELRGMASARHTLSATLPRRSQPVVLNLTSIYEGVNGVISHTGTVEGDDGSLVTLSMQGDEVLGKIHTDGLLYLIQGRNEDYRISVIDSALLPKAEPLDHDHDHGDDAADPAAPVGSRPGRSPGGGNTLMSGSGNVSVLVLYTPAVAANDNVSLLASNVIAQTNSSMAFSGVAGTNYLTLADMQPLSDNLATYGQRCRGDIYDRAAFRLGTFSDLDTRRVAAQADMVLVLFTTETSYTECGTGGRVGGMAFVHSSVNPIAFTADTYALGDLTGPHEIGHVFGGHHEHQMGGTLPYSYGYASTTCTWQTMMGGYEGMPGYEDCVFDYDEPHPAMQPVKRLPRWSNPALSYLGEPTGTSTQNMKAALEALMPIVSAWQADPTAPGTTGSFWVAPLMCYGQHQASWSAVTGATHYQLLVSTSPTFSFPYVMHITGSTTAQFSIQPSEPLYLRVRACNAGGCGGESSQGSATVYYPYCL